MGGRRFDAATFTSEGRPVLVGHRYGEDESVVWRVKNGKLSRISRAPWNAVGIARDGEDEGGVIVIGANGETLAVDAEGAHLGRVIERKNPPPLLGVTELSSGAIVVFGAAGQIYRRTQTRWEPWSIAPPLPRGGAGRPAAPRSPERTIVGVAGDPDTTAWAFAADGSAWSRSGRAWKRAPLPVDAPWTCAASRPGGSPIVAAKGLALVGAGAKWRQLPLGALAPVAVASFDDGIYVADGASVWRVDGKAPKLVLSEPVVSLAVTKKGLVAVSSRSIFLSADGARWAQLI